MDEAAALPAEVGLRWAEDAIRSREWQAYQHAQLVWASIAPHSSKQIDPPEPPEA